MHLYLSIPKYIGLTRVPTPPLCIAELAGDVPFPRRSRGVLDDSLPPVSFIHTPPLGIPVFTHPSPLYCSARGGCTFHVKTAASSLRNYPPRYPFYTHTPPLGTTEPTHPSPLYCSVCGGCTFPAKTAASSRR